MSAIRTQLHTGGGSYSNIDSWALGQSYPDPGDGTSAALWLQSITRTGHTNGDVALPPVTFNGVAMQNRVWVTDGNAPLVKYRIANITTETGAVIAIGYSNAECTPSNLPASAETNTKRCFPQWWTPPMGAARLDYFHKYVITQVTANPGYGNAIQNTSYEYIGTPAWTYNDNPTTPVDKRTWSKYAGYDKVRVLAGDQSAPQSVQRTDYTFYQGTHGDRATPAGGTKTKTVATSDGSVINDDKWLAGQVAEQAQYNGLSGPLAQSVTKTYWSSPVTASNGTDSARIVRPATERSSTPITGASARVTMTTTSYDAQGRPTSVDDDGDVAITTDDLCTRTTYVDNPALNLTSLPSEQTTHATRCASASSIGTLTSSTRTYYDGAGSLTATPVRGDATKVDTSARVDGGAVTYATTSTSYDPYGRATSVTDPLGRISSTAVSDTNGQSTAVTATNPKGWAATVTLDPRRAAPIAQVDIAGKKTEATLDGLGRVTSVWLPGRDKATNATPSISYAYSISASAAPSLKTTTLTPSGAGVSSYAIYDALLNERQTQAPSEGGGRIVTETVTDAAGRAIRTVSPYYALGDPSGALFVPATAVPAELNTTYDGLGRPVSEVQMVNNASKWITTYGYDGQSVTTTPPASAAATRKFTDARGQQTALWTYHGNAASGPYDATTYTHTPAGKLASTTDAAGNVWTWTYDLAGNEVASTDPDTGATTSTYDLTGKKTALTDSRGQTISTAYDELGRVTGTYSAATPSPAAQLTGYTYDTLAKGMPSSSTRYDATGQYTQSVDGYNAAGLPTSTSITIPSSPLSGALAKTYTSTYTYTANNQIASVTHPAAGGLPSEKITTSYSDLGNVDGVLRGAYAYVNSVTYTHLNEIAQVAQTSLNTVQYRSYYYQDGTRRLGRALISTGSVTLADRNYTYTDAGNITKIADNAGPAAGGTDTQCFAYDYAQRLTEAWTPASNDCATTRSAQTLGGPAPYWKSYTYDVTGNRTSTTARSATAESTSTYTYPAAGTAQPHTLRAVTTGASSDTYSYDATGNTTATTINGVTRTYSIGADGHVQNITTDGASTQQNIYDTNGQLLLRKEATGDVTIYLGATQATLHPDGTQSADRAITLGDKTVAVRTNTPGSTANTVTWLDTDNHNTATAMQNPTTGAVTKRFYDPYGNTRGTPPTTWPTPNALLDKPRSPATGNSRFGVRDYDPTTGRFTTRDPIIRIEDPQQINGYNYANNNPIISSDPQGTEPLYCVGIANQECYRYYYSNTPVTGSSPKTAIAAGWDLSIYADPLYRGNPAAAAAAARAKNPPKANQRASGKLFGQTALCFVGSKKSCGSAAVTAVGIVKSNQKKIAADQAKYAIPDAAYKTISKFDSADRKHTYREDGGVHSRITKFRADYEEDLGDDALVTEIATMLAEMTLPKGEFAGKNTKTNGDPKDPGYYPAVKLSVNGHIISVHGNTYDGYFRISTMYIE